MAGLQKFNGLVFPSISDVLDHDLNVSAVDAPFREEKDFIPGSLRFCKDFWMNEILVDHPDKQMLLSWLDGVKIECFLNEYTRDVYKGRSVLGRYPPGVRLPNYVPDEFVDWVTGTINDYVQMGMVHKWASVKGQDEPDLPVLILPLGVEPAKPRLIYDARYLNLFFRHLPFKMDTVGKVPQIAWQNMFLFSLDHKAGYLHVPIHKESWKYLGFEWNGEIYVYSCLPFGTSFSPYVYHTLHEAIASYLRGLGIPNVVYIDDSLAGTQLKFRDANEVVQYQSANRALYVAAYVYFLCGFFIGIKKSEVNPSF